MIGPEDPDAKIEAKIRKLRRENAFDAFIYAISWLVMFAFLISAMFEENIFLLGFVICSLLCMGGARNRIEIREMRRDAIERELSDRSHTHESPGR